MRLRSLIRLLDAVHALVEPKRIAVLGSYQQMPLGEREAFTAGRNLTLLLREFGLA